MTSEQSKAVDHTSGETVPEEQPKPSLLKKVAAKAKAKARKLKTQLMDPNAAQGRTFASHIEDDSDSSSEDRDGLGPGIKFHMPGVTRDKKPVRPKQKTPTAAVRPQQQSPTGAVPPQQQSPTGAVPPQQPSPTGATAPTAEGTEFTFPSSGRSAGSSDSTSSAETKFAVDPAVLKNDGPLGVEQAVPTNYNYFNSDPSIATQPSDFDSRRQRDVPSSLGGESAGKTAATEKLSKETESQFSKRDGSLSKSGDRDSELPRSFMASQDTEQSSDPGLAPPHALTPHNSMNISEWAGGNAPKQSASATSRFSKSATDRSGALSPGQALDHGTAGTAEGAKDAMNRKLNPTPDDSTWTQKAYGMKDSLASSLGYSGSSAPQGEEASAVSPSKGADQKSIASRVTDTAFGLKDSVASKLGYADQTLSSDSTPVSEKAVGSAVQGKTYATNVLRSADQGMSSDEKPVSAKASEAATQAKEAVMQKTTTPDHHEKTLTESIIGLPGMLTSKLGLGGAASPTASSPTSAPAESGSSYKSGSDVPIPGTPSSSASSYDSSTRKDTPYPDHSSTAASHGLYDRVADIASSLFSGGAAKEQPTTEGEKSPFPGRKSI